MDETTRGILKGIVDSVDKVPADRLRSITDGFKEECVRVILAQQLHIPKNNEVYGQIRTDDTLEPDFFGYYLLIHNQYSVLKKIKTKCKECNLYKGDIKKYIRSMEDKMLYYGVAIEESSDIPFPADKLAKYFNWDGNAIRGLKETEEGIVRSLQTMFADEINFDKCVILFEKLAMLPAKDNTMIQLWQKLLWINELKKDRKELEEARDREIENLEEEKTITEELMPYFANNKENVDSFLHDIDGLRNSTGITDIVNKYSYDKKILKSCTKWGGLGHILAKYHIYEKTESTWNRNVN